MVADDNVGQSVGATKGEHTQALGVWELGSSNIASDGLAGAATVSVGVVEVTRPSSAGRGGELTAACTLLRAQDGVLQ